MTHYIIQCIKAIQMIRKLAPIMGAITPLIILLLFSLQINENLGMKINYANAKDQNPLLGMKLYIDPNSNARAQINEWKISRPGDAKELEKIATQPQAKWFGDWNIDIRKDVKDYIKKVHNENAIPLLVIYNIPLRDCGSFSKGGASNVESYKQWVDSFIDGVGTSESIVVVEPDALAGMDCLNDKQKMDRIEAMSYAINKLTKSKSYVYIDIGNPFWLNPTDAANRIKSISNNHLSGFVLNVSNFATPQENYIYGKKISEKLNNMHFLIDSSRNGNGANSNKDWCNPRGRALGNYPTVDTMKPLVDAYLWIKLPGESDGYCNGGPKAGNWWPEYALELAKNKPL
ncbi:MAG: glycoside hydrolase family 6 protein [Candidatus Levyibacteriota bacterium]